MSVDERWSHYFKPEVRSKGAEYFESGDVHLSIAADTQIQAYVNDSGRARVSLTTDSIASPSFDADCSCSHSAKGQLCKHIWATLLEVEKSHPDFLDSKNEFDKTSKAARPKAKVSEEKARDLDDRQLALKAKQSDFRKQQYQFQKQKQKERLRGKKQDQKKAHKAPSFELPDDVASALKFFSENGFPLEVPIQRDAVMNARKILARVFHPDKGGSHDEALALNQNCDILLDFV